MTELIENGEKIARCALYPRSIAADGTFSEEMVIGLGALKDGRKGHACSVARRKLLPTVELMHHYGCRTALAANANKAKYLGRPLIRGEDTVHYRGYCDIVVDDVRSISVPCYVVEVVSHPLPELPEHAQIELLQCDGDWNKAVRASQRTMVIAMLYAFLKAPEFHSCPEDADIAVMLPRWPAILPAASALWLLS